MIVCTLMLVMATTPRDCITRDWCVEDAGHVCIKHQPSLCKVIHQPTYECVRSDGTKYIYEDKSIRPPVR